MVKKDEKFESEEEERSRRKKWRKGTSKQVGINEAGRKGG